MTRRPLLVSPMALPPGSTGLRMTCRAESLGLAWGQELVPNSAAEIMLATPDMLVSAVASTVD